MGGGELEASTVEECRVLLDTDSPILNEKFRVWYGINIDSRLSVLENGIVDLAFDIIRKNSPNHGQAIKEAWQMLSEIVIVFDVEDDQEYIPIEQLVEKGLIPMMAAEFNRRRLELNKTELLHSLSWCASREIAIEPIMKADLVHKYAISVIKEGPTHENFDTSMSLIRSLSGSCSNQIRAKLREDGALDAVLPFVDNLKCADDDEKLKQGYRAASIVARLAGNDESGIGPKILHGNPLLVNKTVWILDRALDAGPKASVINMRVNPHHITMDLLTISTSDVNKPLLKSSIPILIKSLKLRGKTNEKMVVDIVKTLLQLTYDKECLQLMRINKEELINLIEKLVVSPTYDMEAMMAATNLVNVLSTEPQATASVAGKPGRLAALMRMAVKDSKKASSSAVDGKERRKSINAAPADKHVMLSYNWNVKPIVHKVDELLRANGIKTWLDIRDMGQNVNDSMANAIENAYVLFAFITSKYKESANCRKECEYADGRNIPIVYIMAEEGYKPNGWLGLQLGKSLWIACWHTEMVEESLPNLLQLARSSSSSANNGKGIAASSNVNNKPVESPSTSSNNNNKSMSSSSPDLVALLTSMRAQMDSMATQLEQLKASHEELKANHASLQNAFFGLEKKIDGK